VENCSAKYADCGPYTAQRQAWTMRLPSMNSHMLEVDTSMK
jgi:hypothetical protein